MFDYWRVSDDISQKMGSFHATNGAIFLPTLDDEKSHLFTTNLTKMYICLISPQLPLQCTTITNDLSLYDHVISYDV